jgi:hypothetical protein
MRCTTLSVDENIRLISDKFVAFAVNVTSDNMEEICKVLPGLTHVKNAHTKNWYEKRRFFVFSKEKRRFAFGFASCVALCSGGDQILGFVSASDAKDSLVFKNFLSNAEERNQSVSALRARLQRGEFQQAGTELRNLLASVGAEIALRMSRVREQW